jgi:hypothetical protein
MFFVDDLTASIFFDDDTYIMSSPNYIGAAMTFVAGLAWNDAIKSAMEEYVKRPDEGLRGKFAYAIIVTMLTIIIIYTVSRLSASYKPNVPVRVLSRQTLEDIKKLSPITVINKHASPSIPSGK